MTLRPFDPSTSSGLRARDERTRFAESAGRLAGLVPRALGWRPGEFWEATPAELAVILAPAGEFGGEPLSRTEMTALMERDRHG